MQGLESKNTQLATELAGINVSLGARLAKGEKIALNEART